MQGDKHGAAHRIREASTRDRRAITLQLAREHPDDVLPELIRMTERGRRSTLRWYTREDQITGIRALGATGRQTALDYLESIVHEDVVVETRNVTFNGQRSGGGNSYKMSFQYRQVQFTNAPKALRPELEYFELAGIEAYRQCAPQTKWSGQRSGGIDEAELKPLDMTIHTEIRESITRLRSVTVHLPRVEDAVWEDPDHSRSNGVTG